MVVRREEVARASKNNWLAVDVTAITWEFLNIPSSRFRAFVRGGVDRVLQ